jgi:hypothetical protein
MKKQLLSAVMLCALGFAGCGEGETIDSTGNDNPNTPAAKKFDTSAKILAHLEGKTMVMQGPDIPSHPNGFDEDVNFGSASQCYKSVAMAVASGTFNVTSTLGTLRDAPTIGAKGSCDHTTVAGTLQFSSTNTLIENIQGDGECFDVTFTYTGFQQEGRGKISADGKTLMLELYFKDKAVNIRCANGAVGATGVKVNGADHTGDSRQIYTIQ